MAATVYAEIERPYFGGTLLSAQVYGGLRLAEVEYKTVTSCTEHMHEPAFFSLLLHGVYEEAQRDDRIHYGAFDLGFHPKGTVHSDAVKAACARFFLIELPDAWTEVKHGRTSALKQETQLCPPPSGWLAARLYREHCDANLHCPLVAEVLVSQLLYRLVPETRTVLGTRPKWLDRVTDLLQSEFRNKITLSQVANEVDLHPVYLSRAFRRYYGESLGDIASRLRVQFAQKKMCDPDISLAEVALLAGFSDQSQFTRVFRGHTGLTPGAFRKIAGFRPSTGAKSAERS